MTEFSFFAHAADLSVAEIAALTGAEPCEGADLSRLVRDMLDTLAEAPRPA